MLLGLCQSILFSIFLHSQYSNSSYLERVAVHFGQEIDSRCTQPSRLHGMHTECTFCRWCIIIICIFFVWKKVILVSVSFTLSSALSLSYKYTSNFWSLAQSSLFSCLGTDLVEQMSLLCQDTETMWHKTISFLSVLNLSMSPTNWKHERIKVLWTFVDQGLLITNACRQFFLSPFPFNIKSSICPSLLRFSKS